MKMVVEQHESGWQQRQGHDDDLEVHGLGPCTGIVVTCEKDKVAGGAHLVAPAENDSDHLERFLNEAASKYPEGSNLEVTVSGCCSTDNTKYRKTRKYVESRISKVLPKAQLRREWPPKDVLVVDMTVDMGTCKVRVEMCSDLSE